MNGLFWGGSVAGGSYGCLRSTDPVCPSVTWAAACHASPAGGGSDTPGNDSYRGVREQQGGPPRAGASACQPGSTCSRLGQREERQLPLLHRCRSRAFLGASVSRLPCQSTAWRGEHGTPWACPRSAPTFSPHTLGEVPLHPSGWSWSCPLRFLPSSCQSSFRLSDIGAGLGPLLVLLLTPPSLPSSPLCSRRGRSRGSHSLQHGVRARAAAAGHPLRHHHPCRVTGRCCSPKRPALS